MTNARSSRLPEVRPRTGEEIRTAFLAFFAARDHKVINSASLVPEDPTVLLTIAGMLPFKPVFLGQKDRPSARATSSQKCIRTNDIENVGKTQRHQTFFEMLGNFSFGDYFKKEAIIWAWELTTEVYGLDPKHLVVSVFREDKEAEEIWRDLVGVHPQRIIRMDEADNFWASGPTGPCGPCSEIYYDFKPELGVSDIDLEDDTRFIEFYNLVFMQYNRNLQGKLTPLATCNIDTGMGLERMAQILQQVPNNYETDLIYPLIEKAASLAGVDYHNSDVQKKTSLKVIGDHSRAITQLISDGVKATNIGRGYVLRRLLRRVVRHGRLIGIKKPFLVEIGKATIDLMKTTFPELLERQDVICKELEHEESRFLETLERGEKMLSDLLKNKPKQITGDQAFELYDTYGFPLELTEEIAEEHQSSVDKSGFKQAMDAQKQRAKDANVRIDLTRQNAIERLAGASESTSFCGYHLLDLRSQVIALLVNGEVSNQGHDGDNVQLILDKTPFYGEGGGQIGDRGILLSDMHELHVVIESVSRIQDVFIHYGYIEKGTLEVGQIVKSCVDGPLRRRLQANHTSTHLLQAALKKVVDSSIGQAGSLVDFQRLRFDFHSSNPIKSSELDQIDKLINTWIAEAHTLHIKDMDLEIAKAEGAVAMFGEKYKDVVRVVDVPGVSMELCGGTHVSNTAEIGAFKIISETGIAAGIRRIEAVAGPAILDYLNERDLVVKQLAERLKAKPIEIVPRVQALQEELKNTGKALLKVQEELALSKVSWLADQSQLIGCSQVVVQRLDGIDGLALQTIAQTLVEKLGDNTAIVLGGVPNSLDPNKVGLVAAFGPKVVSRGLKAGNFIGSIAKLCGGGGGGRPNLAQAGGRDATSLKPALDYAKEQLKSILL